MFDLDQIDKPLSALRLLVPIHWSGEKSAMFDPVNDSQHCVEVIVLATLPDESAVLNCFQYVALSRHTCPHSDLHYFDCTPARPAELIDALISVRLHQRRYPTWQAMFRRYCCSNQSCGRLRKPPRKTRGLRWRCRARWQEIWPFLDQSRI